MAWFCRKITKNFSWEVAALYKFRDFSDGISFFGITCDLDTYEGDHNPQFVFRIEMLNFILVEFGIYNIHHVFNEDKEQ